GLERLVTGGDGDRHLAAPLGDEGGDLLGSLTGDVLAEQGRAGQGATLELLRVGERAAGEEDGEHREGGHQHECDPATAVSAGGSQRAARRGRIGHVRHGFRSVLGGRRDCPRCTAREGAGVPPPSRLTFRVTERTYRTTWGGARPSSQRGI